MKYPKIQYNLTTCMTLLWQILESQRFSSPLRFGDQRTENPCVGGSIPPLPNGF